MYNSFMSEEITMLVQDGFSPGYMMDIQVGDLIAIPPVSRTPIFGDERDGDRHKVQTFFINRVESHEEEDGSGVIMFIGTDVFDLPRHNQYGYFYPCMIKRGN